MDLDEKKGGGDEDEVRVDLVLVVGDEAKGDGNEGRGDAGEEKVVVAVPLVDVDEDRVSADLIFVEGDEGEVAAGLVGGDGETPWCGKCTKRRGAVTPKRDRARRGPNDLGHFCTPTDKSPPLRRVPRGSGVGVDRSVRGGVARGRGERRGPLRRRR